MPGPPGRIFFGNAFDLVYKPAQQQMAKWAEEYGPIYKLSLPGAMVVVLTEPEAITTVIKLERFEKDRMMYKVLEEITSETLPNMLTVPTGPYYRAVRKAITPAFSSANLRQFFPELVSLTERLAAQLMTHGSVVPVDVDRAAQRLTIDVIGRFAFDRDFGALGFSRSEELEAICALMLALETSQNPLNRWFWWRKVHRPDYWLCTVNQYRLTMLVPAMAEARVAEELDVCGLLATSTRPKPRPVTWGDLGQLRYLNAVIQEALRLMPPVSAGTIRTAPRDTRLAGKDVPAGATVWIPHYAVQRSSRTWGADAGRFRPERWLTGFSGLQQQQQGEKEEEGKLPKGQSEGVTDGGGSSGGDGAVRRTAAAAAAVMATDDEEEIVKAAATTAARGWLPFSDGPRNCVGQSLALLELRTTLATLCGRFRFRLAEEMGGVEGVVAAARQDVTLKPGDKGLLMHVIPRVP
ncbi:hypothetical protein VOLCADRAFT_107481, partial [Volvox carteri f. nagariensis]